VRARFGLDEGAFVFASFNAAHKLDPALVEAWVAIHRAVPAALFLVYLADQARPRFVAHWQAHGGDPAVLRFVGTVAFDEQLLRMQCADVVLDAFRHHAGATAVMSAAAGVPILCRPGDRPAARLSSSLNGFLGLDELVVDTPGDYVAKAIALASPGAAGAVGTQLREAADARALFDPARTAHALERLYLSLG
jgi:predicted O-linked N-acetylglucosamine transferase (SPINDLY family)